MLVLGGCGSAVLAAAFPEVGIGLAGVSLAFGLTVLTMAYAIGHISGCHLNPAVSLGLVVGGRFPAKELLPYVVSGEKWISEGFASYYQNVLLARRGVYSESEVWQRLHRAFAQADAIADPPEL